MAARKTKEMRELERRYDELYEQYGRPLEAEHWGEFLVISAEGETLIGSTMGGVAKLAAERFGSGTFMYKVGERAVGRLR